MATYGDKELLHAILSGDNQKALQWLYKESLPKIKNLVRRLGGTSDDAKDVFQDGVVILYRKILSGEFLSSDNPEAFLYTMCRNSWLNKLKRNKVVYHSQIPDKMDDEPSVLRHMEIKENEQLVNHVFDRLGQKCARLLKLIYLQHLEADEIVKELQMASADVLKTTKNRCRNKLTELMQNHPQLVKTLGGKE